ncbi:MAG: divergent PAP2 family protein [Clostridiales bacterium]|nr:divergent PAP2 family protein [Clostridiales bacterium]
MTFTDFLNNKFLWVPVSIWLIIQIWKFIFDLIKNRKINLKRLIGAGGMPSSHSAVVASLATLIGKSEGLNSPIFALSCIFALVVMYDATGVRRAAGKQARILNQIINSKEVKVNVPEKLVEFLGHTPFEVFVGFIIGIGYALLF